jgi:hypothetical protein
MSEIFEMYEQATLLDTDTSTSLQELEVFPSASSGPASLMTSLSVRAAFPVRTSATPGSVQASTASGAASGANTPVLLASYAPASCSWRTSQLCLDGALAEYSETWPRSGTMRNGTAYRLPPLVPRTSATAFSYWPTPNANNFNDGEGLETWLARREREKAKHRNGNGFGTPLAIAVQMFPTPTAHRWDGLQSHGVNVVSGSLNPMWVELLMGFPPGWTDLED